MQQHRRGVDADPVEAALRREEQHDHALAPARGARVALIAETVVNALLARGILPDPDAAGPVVTRAIADCLYGNQAIDVPSIRRATREGIIDGVIDHYRAFFSSPAMADAVADVLKQQLGKATL